MLKSSFKIRNNKKQYSTGIPQGILSHCSYCGEKYDDEWTKLQNLKTCQCCNNISYRNPIPVAVGILPFVNFENGRGLLLVQRSIKPFIGEFCLPGGFINWGESWQQCLTREIYEETHIITNPDEFELANTYSTPDNTRILIFGLSKRIRSVKILDNFEATEETSSVKIGFHNDKLCFSLHQNVYNTWFFSNIRIKIKNILE